MSEHKRWESMKKVIARLRGGGWFTPNTLLETLNEEDKEKKANLRTIKHDLRLGTFTGIFKHDKDKGQYAWIDYSDDEPFILEAIGEYLDNHLQLREKERSISFADIDEIIDIASVKTGKPREDIEKLAREVIKRHFEQRG